MRTTKQLIEIIPECCFVEIDKQNMFRINSHDFDEEGEFELRVLDEVLDEEYIYHFNEPEELISLQKAIYYKLTEVII